MGAGSDRLALPQTVCTASSTEAGSPGSGGGGCSLRNAAELGIDWQNLEFDPSLLDHERENNLLGMVGEFPRVVASAAELRGAARAAEKLAAPTLDGDVRETALGALRLVAKQDITPYSK